jgi:transposase
MTRLYGRAPRGERVIGAVPQNYGANVTMLASLGSQGIEAMMTSEGATDAEVFRVYVEQMLRPTRHPGDIVIMDNLRAHKATGIREAIEQTGARVLYLPPYSPDLAPIERCWAKLKSILRTAKARSVRPWMRPLLRHWPPSPPRMHEAGSSIVAMPYSNSRTALN